MDAKSFLKDCKISVWEETFAVIKSKQPDQNAFANIKDKKEITAVIEEDKYNKDNALAIDKGWKIITFDTVLPFEVVGFLAAVSNVLAEEGVPILTFSSYSTDHILVKEKNLNRVLERLKQLGCRVA